MVRCALILGRLIVAYGPVWCARMTMPPDSLQMKPPCVDKNRRPVCPGDLLKVFHFTAAGRGKRKVYMYKFVCRGNNHLKIEKNGVRLLAVDIATAGGCQSLTHAHKCFVEQLDDFEIIDSLDVFWERSKIA